MKYHQIIFWDGNLRAINYEGSSVVISLDELVPVGRPKELISIAQDIRKELTEEVNEAFPVVEKDGVTANAFINTYLGADYPDDKDKWESTYSIQFYYIEIKNAE